MEAAGFNPYNSFNSTLVQLKVVVLLDIGHRVICFNSTLVQLKAVNTLMSCSVKLVSILP